MLNQWEQIGILTSSTRTSYVSRSPGSGGMEDSPPSRLMLMEPFCVCLRGVSGEEGSDGWKLHITRAVSACMVKGEVEGALCTKRVKHVFSAKDTHFN